MLAELYRLLVAATWRTESFASPLGDEDAKRKQYGVALDGIAEYFRFFDQHRIFLPEELCPLLEELATKLRYPTIMFGTYLSVENPTDKTVEEKRNAWMDAWNSVKNDVPAMRSAIEGEFRKLLGGVPALPANTALDPTPARAKDTRAGAGQR